jgi:hypothetical protein
MFRRIHNTDVISLSTGDRVRSFSDLMMAAYLKVIQKTLSHPDPSTNYVHEDALMAIGSLANGIFSQSIQLL